MSIAQEFQKMYETKHFVSERFDPNGFLQTDLTELGHDQAKMPLPFFVDYNNAWWFEIIDGVEVPELRFDPANGEGYIQLEIRYDGDRMLHASQTFTVVDDRIVRIRTTAPPDFFTNNRDSELVDLDTYGNQIWLDPAYDFQKSVAAAQRFLASPEAAKFHSNPKTQPSLQRIQANLQKH